MATGITIRTIAVIMPRFLATIMTIKTATSKIVKTLKNIPNNCLNFGGVFCNSLLLYYIHC
jgi:hypothetical protein